jgi:hypothetical protein
VHQKNEQYNYVLIFFVKAQYNRALAAGGVAAVAEMVSCKIKGVLALSEKSHCKKNGCDEMWEGCDAGC